MPHSKNWSKAWLTNGPLRVITQAWGTSPSFSLLPSRGKRRSGMNRECPFSSYHAIWPDGTVYEKPFRHVRFLSDKNEQSQSARQKNRQQTGSKKGPARENKCRIISIPVVSSNLFHPLFLRCISSVFLPNLECARKSPATP